VEDAVPRRHCGSGILLLHLLFLLLLLLLLFLLVRFSASRLIRTHLLTAAFLIRRVFQTTSTHSTSTSTSTTGTASASCGERPRPLSIIQR
jgi:hypothetical protein